MIVITSIMTRGIIFHAKILSITTVILNLFIYD